MRVPKPDKPPYAPTTPVTDTFTTPRRQGIFGVSTSVAGLQLPASTQKKVLIGGSV